MNQSLRMLHDIHVKAHIFTFLDFPQSADRVMTVLSGVTTFVHPVQYYN